ncbi:MAG: hypothetical protein JSW56_13325 [Deltaproteobacteria bacterium]|nr:MAG: hypothetical protein JSW56_13325 [Deltaproteobacteria bacterium]
MGELLHFPDPLEFGQCPRCGGNDGYYCVDPEKWGVCDKHRLKWHRQWDPCGEQDQYTKEVQEQVI